MSAADIINKYISFFEKREHKRILNSPLVPQNDPTTLFTSSGMQPLVPYLLGEPHPQGKRLVNVQNCFRAQDIDEVGDSRHTTFFRMLGNWSLGDYFKIEQIPWMFEFITNDLGLEPKKLYVSIFEGYDEISKDTEAQKIWEEVFSSHGLDPKERISSYGPEKNWWSRSGVPEKMPAGEPGGPDSEIFYDFGTGHDPKFGKTCHINCDCGRFFEISNSVFMQFQKQPDGSFNELPKKNVDHGAGLERFLSAAEHKPDVFQTSLLLPVIKELENHTGQKYSDKSHEMRIITDHIVGAVFMTADGVYPANKDQGYILRRLIRRAYDHFSHMKGKSFSPIIETVVDQYKDTDPKLVEKFEEIKNTILEESDRYSTVLHKAKAFIEKKYDAKPIGDELKGVKEISADDAFILYSTHGLSPTQIKNLGYIFDDQAYAQKMEEHQSLSRKGGEQKFRGGLADHQEKTVMGHTATHLLHQALRDLLGKHVHQSGSNITAERLRFDFNYDQKLTDEQIKHLEDVVNEKIKENIPVHFEMIPTEDAHKMGAIGLFMDTYGEKSKIYFIGGDSAHPEKAYSIEFCGGPHVDFTGRLKSFKIIKQENIGNKQRRLYAVVGE